MKKHGMFRKIFIYTLLFLILTISIVAAIFSQQFLSFYESKQVQQFNKIYEPLIGGLDGKSIDESIEISDEFHKKNQSFEFFIETADGEIIYNTPNAFESVNQQYTLMLALPQNMVLRASGVIGTTNAWSELFPKTAVAIGIMLAVTIIGAFFFARVITNPIRKIADDTRKMASLKPVSAPNDRQDELGQLAHDVYNMYEKLKHTISALETEIERKREMEENQRYFFSAASHELKTPIAATKAVVEGMLADIGDYKNHPKYLRECLKMLKAQNKIITEILEIVNLSNDRIQVKIESIKLSELIQGIIPEYTVLAESKGQTLTIDIADDVVCRADKALLSRVISNIIMNAVQNTQENENIRIWCERKSEKKIALNILNTNTQIDNDIISKLFEPFYRPDKARSRSSGRSGLGLALVKKMLDIMNIPFRLENTKEGVLFWIELTAMNITNNARECDCKLSRSAHCHRENKI